MTLSQEQRQLLLAQAGELRADVSSLTAERDLALVDKAQELEDAKLVSEVLRLKRDRDEALRQRDIAVNSTAGALDIMQAAIEAQVTTAESQVKVEPAEDLPMTDPAEPAESAQSNTTTKKTGGSK
jgi:hypothetical protein